MSMRISRGKSFSSTLKNSQIKFTMIWIAHLIAKSYNKNVGVCCPNVLQVLCYSPSETGVINLF